MQPKLSCLSLIWMWQCQRTQSLISCSSWILNFVSECTFLLHVSNFEKYTRFILFNCLMTWHHFLLPRCQAVTVTDTYLSLLYITTHPSRCRWRRWIVLMKGVCQNLWAGTSSCSTGGLGVTLQSCVVWYQMCTGTSTIVGVTEIVSLCMPVLAHSIFIQLCHRSVVEPVAHTFRTPMARMRELATVWIFAFQPFKLHVWNHLSYTVHRFHGKAMQHYFQSLCVCIDTFVVLLWKACNQNKKPFQEAKLG